MNEQKFGSTEQAELARAKRMLAAHEKPTTVKQQVADALNPPSMDLDDLLTQARAQLKLPVSTAGVEDEVEATDPELINTLVAQAEEFKREIDRATKERAKITTFLKELVVSVRDARHPDGTVPKAVALTVNKAPVFSVLHVTSRVLDQDYVKSRFPDTPKNEAFWKDLEVDRADYK